MANDLMLRLGLQADETPGKWMLRVSRDPRDLPILDMDQDPAFTVRGLTQVLIIFSMIPPSFRPGLPLGPRRSRNGDLWEDYLFPNE